ncbi:MAG TPA: maltose alpha-D-glucosyltransferase [Bellilinea sp.]|nr:maltose alpha-D-glucosyltransferase [Bellilinea sp.]
MSLVNDTLWYKNAIFYEVYIRAFRDTNGDGHGDLPGVIEKLDYLRELGVDCIWLQPLYLSPLRDDGYDIADYYKILPEYGTVEDFKNLIAAAHQRGMRVITDLVMNHTSDQHPWFQMARKDRTSPYRNYYVWSDTDDRYKDVRIIFLDTEKSNWTWDEEAGQYFWHRFFSCQPDLNYDNPAVRDEMLNIIRYWLEMGIDGFRADAIPYLYEREGTNGENLPETHAFLKEIRAFMNANYPDAILLGEANQWPEDVKEYFSAGDELHMNFHFPLMPRMYMALGKGDVTSLKWVFERTPEIPHNCQWCTFLRNHDELTLEMVTEDERQYMWKRYAPNPRMRLNLGIRRRLAPLMDNDQRRIRLLFSMLFSMPGTPILYYGDEIGMGDNIELFDRNGVRTPMQWTDGINAGFSDAPAEHLYTPIIASSAYNAEEVNVAASLEDKQSLYYFIRHLIRLRKEHPELASGAMEWLPVGTNSVAAYRRADGDQVLAAIHNLKDAPVNIRLEIPGIDTPVKDLLTGSIAYDPFDYRLSLQPYQTIWFSN